MNRQSLQSDIEHEKREKTGLQVWRRNKRGNSHYINRRRENERSSGEMRDEFDFKHTETRVHAR